MSAISPPSPVVHISFQTLFETQTKIVVFNSKIKLKHAIMYYYILYIYMY